jgi:hypothetical protein
VALAHEPGAAFLVASEEGGDDVGGVFLQGDHPRVHHRVELAALHVHARVPCNGLLHSPRHARGSRGLQREVGRDVPAPGDERVDRGAGHLDLLGLLAAALDLDGFHAAPAGPRVAQERAAVAAGPQLPAHTTTGDNRGEARADALGAGADLPAGTADEGAEVLSCLRGAEHAEGDAAAGAGV